MPGPAAIIEKAPAFAARNQVSLCMIVRDEEQHLERCLRSALPWVKEAVVVDTGSADGTVGLATALGARVLHFPWCDDFSEARNRALDAATTPWTLVLDADETLVVDDANAWARAIALGETPAYSIDCHDQLDQGGVSVGPILRLFRGDLPGMRYRGQVHEQIAAVADHKYATAHARFLHIRHEGYTAAMMRSRGKVDRNLSLARSMVAARSGDPFAWFCLGQALEAAQSPPVKIIEVYEKALSLFLRRGQAEQDESYLAALWINLTRVVMRSGDRRKADELSSEAVAVFPNAPDLRFLRGRLLVEDGRYAAAAMQFEACLTPAAQSFFIRQDPGSSSYAAETQLGLCRLRLGQLAPAETALRHAVVTSPLSFVLPRLLLGMLLLTKSAPEEAEGVLRAAVEAQPENRDARLNWGRALLALGRREDAEQALAPLREDPRASALLASTG